MKKEAFSRLAMELLKRENHSIERVLERLDEMEDVCLLSGKMGLIPTIDKARSFIQRNY